MSNIDIEELLKSEELAKSVDKRTLNKLLMYMDMMKDPAIPKEHKEKLRDNIQAIINYQKPKPIKEINERSSRQMSKEPNLASKDTNKQQGTMQAKQPTSSAQENNIPFPEDFHVHHNVDPWKFKQAWEKMTPEQRKTTLEWHKQKIAEKKKAAQEEVPFPEDYHLYHNVNPWEFKDAWRGMTNEQKKAIVEQHKKRKMAQSSAGSEEIKFPEDFHVHHGVDPVKFKQAWEKMTPEQRKITLEWHKQKLQSMGATSTPTSTPTPKVENTVGQQPKSIIRPPSMEISTTGTKSSSSSGSKLDTVTEAALTHKADPVKFIEAWEKLTPQQKQNILENPSTRVFPRRRSRGW